MSTATNATQKQPKRFPADFGGVSLEYVRKRSTIAKLFNLEHLAGDFPSLNTALPVRIYYIAGTDMAFEHPLVPSIETNYKFDMWDLAVLLPYFVEGKGLPPYIFGLQGTGKSSLVEQIHARLGLPRAHVILGEDSEVIDLGGQLLPTEAGGMRHFDGLLAQTMRNGWTLQFDEYDLLPTRQQKMLNEVLENRRFTIEVTGEHITAHPDWRVCVTANTNNTGSGNGMFTSSGGGDASVNERFQFLEKFYMNHDDENEVLKGHAKVHLMQHPTIRRDPNKLPQLMSGVEAMIEQMQKVAERIRKAHEQSQKATANGGMALNCVMSTRTAKEWLRSAIDLAIFFDGAKQNSVLMELMERAFTITFVKGVSYEEQADVMQIYNDSISTN